MTSESTILSSQANLSFNGSDHGAHRGQSISEISFCQDSDLEVDQATDEKSKANLEKPPQAQGIWQRKHNRYVMSVLQMKTFKSLTDHQTHHHVVTTKCQTEDQVKPKKV